MNRFLQIILILSIPTFASAGFFDNVLDSAKKAGEKVNEAVKTVGELNQPDDDQQDSPPQNNESPSPTESDSSSSNNASSSTTSNKNTDNTTVELKAGDISIEQLPAARRPSSYRMLSLAKLRFDDSWLNEKNLLKSTESSIACQQQYRVSSYAGIKGGGCMGEIIREGHQLNLKLAPVFSDSEIEGRNPKFAARELSKKQYGALIKLSQHLPLEFGDTVGWRGTYDFEKGILNIELRGFEKAQGDITSKLPKDIQYLDIRKTRSRNNWDGSGGEHYEVNIAPSYVGGVIAIAFDRNLSKGELTLPAAKAETLFNSGQGYTSGRAVVEYKVTGSAGEAVLATLEKVLVLSSGDDPKDIKNAKPIMTLSASTFPKMDKPVPVVAEKPKQKPVTVPKAKPVPVEPTPLVRVNKGMPYGPDLVGLQLGMSLDEADKTIRKHKQPKDIVSGKPEKPFKTLKGYLLEPGDEAIVLATLDTASGEKIASYIRYRWFDPASAPSQVAIASSIEKKYGKTSYTYEVESQFNRRWNTDWQGGYLDSEIQSKRQIGNCKAGASMRSNLGFKKANGYPYLWFLPWFKERPVGTFWGIRAGNLKQTGKYFNRCGTTLEARYESGSGDLYGPTLSFLLFDGPWIMDAMKKAEVQEKSQGATGLDL